MISPQPTPEGVQSALLPEECLASLLVLPGSDEARATTAGSGRRLLRQYPRSGPLGLCLKILLESTAWTSTAVYLKWEARPLKKYRRSTNLHLMGSAPRSKRSVTKSSRLLFLLRPSRPRISGCESLFWPTPNAAPVSYDTTLTCSGDHREKPNKLGWAVMLPTPRASDGAKGGPKQCFGDGSPTLAAMAANRDLWPTPTVQDSKNNGGPSQHDRHTPPLNALFGALNPEWVSVMMGFPPFWTEED